VGGVVGEERGGGGGGGHNAVFSALHSRLKTLDVRS